MSTFCPQVHLPDGFSVKVGCVDPKTSLEKEDSASIFLPHQVFAQLGVSITQLSSKNNLVLEKTN